jgi:hypothetical protein
LGEAQPVADYLTADRSAADRLAAVHLEVHLKFHLMEDSLPVPRFPAHRGYRRDRCRGS